MYPKSSSRTHTPGSRPALTSRTAGIHTLAKHAQIAAQQTSPGAVGLIHTCCHPWLEAAWHLACKLSPESPLLALPSSQRPSGAVGLNYACHHQSLEVAWDLARKLSPESPLLALPSFQQPSQLFWPGLLHLWSHSSPETVHRSLFPPPITCNLYSP